MLPGTGLILRHREWLGLCVALVFGITVIVGLAGGLVAPEAVPHWVTILATTLAASTWMLAQLLLLRQNQIDGRCDDSWTQLLNEAVSALERQDVSAAQDAIARAVSCGKTGPNKDT